MAVRIFKTRSLLSFVISCGQLHRGTWRRQHVWLRVNIFFLGGGGKPRIRYSFGKLSIVQFMSRGRDVGLVTVIRAGRHGICITAGTTFYCISRTCGPVLVPTQPHFQWVPGIRFWGYYGLGMELATDIHIVSWICMNEAVMLFRLYCSMS